MTPPVWSTTRYALKGIWLLLIGLAALAMLAFGGVQTVRLEGAAIWPVKIEGWKPRAERLATDNKRLAGEKKALVDAQAEAGKRQRDIVRDAEERYSDIAERIDHEARIEEPRQIDAAERYIAANRMRCPAAGSASRATGPASGGGSARDGQATGEAPELDDPRTTGRGSSVAVSADDVRICTTNTVQAEAAREWAIELERTSRPPPPDQR